MATKAQLAANRANAQKSTGPKTTQGKAASRLNALSYGFEAATHFIPGENPEDAYGLLADLNHEFKPATATEQILVEKMFHNQWLSLRAIRLQSDALRFRMEQYHGETPQDLGLLIRYQTAADRAFHKAHAELVKAQKERKNSEIGFVPETIIADEVADEKAIEPQPELQDDPAPSIVENTPEPLETPEVTIPTPEIFAEYDAFEAELAEMLGVTVAELTRAA